MKCGKARWKAEKLELKTKKVEKKCTMKCGKVGIKNEESGKEMHDEMRKSLKRKRRKWKRNAR
jgi:hypothetical protein